MSLLLPVTTMILIGLGAFCIFISIENDRTIRRKTAAADTPFLPHTKSRVSYTGRTDQ
ncbi:hypothetical protein [Paenibacillus piri]|uniref:hypothetical protein n=1 Tax=Paenibacillus piri TaxID=2547395 RepID=UPI001404734D|nr:hypothetical protein [Paenibacillus piri]